MGSAIITLIMIGIVLTGVGVLSQGTLFSVAMIADSWKEMEVRTGDIVRTQLEVLSTANTPPTVTVTLRNPGQTPLRDFISWDVMLQYYESDGTYHQVWLPYVSTTPPGDNQWTVEGIYVDAATSDPEVFQPNILDPGEEIVITVKLLPTARTSGQNQIVIATPNGIAASGMF
jgi:hypothetical protein